MLDWMTRFVLGDSGIICEALSKVTKFGVRSRMSFIAVIGVNHMAGGATAGAVISGVIVCPQKR